MFLGSHRTTVLVVEDDQQLRTHYRAALKAAGYEVVAVDDGLTALRQVEQALPDAVVLDLGLPRLHGRDVYRELATNPMTSGIPVVVVTGQPLSDVHQAATRDPRGWDWGPPDFALDILGVHLDLVAQL